MVRSGCTHLLLQRQRLFFTLCGRHFTQNNKDDCKHLLQLKSIYVDQSINIQCDVSLSLFKHTSCDALYFTYCQQSH